jgi:hypothetical protein
LRSPIRFTSLAAVSKPRRNQDDTRPGRLKDPKAKAAKPADFVDTRFVEEFDKIGFIDNSTAGKR